MSLSKHFAHPLRKRKGHESRMKPAPFENLPLPWDQPSGRKHEQNERNDFRQWRITGGKVETRIPCSPSPGVQRLRPNFSRSYSAAGRHQAGGWRGLDRSCWSMHIWLSGIGSRSVSTAQKWHSVAIYAQGRRQSREPESSTCDVETIAACKSSCWYAVDVSVGESKNCPRRKGSILLENVLPALTSAATHVQMMCFCEWWSRKGGRFVADFSKRQEER